MREHPDHYDAELLLRLYDLRREAKLRDARDWFARQFHASTLEEMNRLCPLGSQANAFFRMVVDYWDMAASIVSHGLIKEEFFFENTVEFWLVWQKLKAIAPAMREAYGHPLLWKNLEQLAEKYERWMAKRAPEALERRRQQILQGS